MSQLGAVLTFQRKPQEAAKVYAELDKAIAGWEPARRQVLELNGSRINALFASGQIEAGLGGGAGIAQARNRPRRRQAFRYRGRPGHVGGRAMRSRAGADAVREFKAAIPVLMAASRENADDDDDTVTAARSQRLQAIVEAYIALLAKTNDNATGEVSLETFALADSIRGQNRCRRRCPRRAPAASPRIRRWPNWCARSRTSASRSTPSSARSTTRCRPNARDENVVKATRPSIEKLRADRNRIRAGNQQALPELCRTDRPEAADRRADQGDAGRRRGDAVVLFRPRRGSFVWAVPKDGPVAFAAIKASSRRHRKQGAQAARGAGAAGGDDLRHPAVRSRARLRALFAAAASRSRPAGSSRRA